MADRQQASSRGIPTASLQHQLERLPVKAWRAPATPPIPPQIKTATGSFSWKQANDEGKRTRDQNSGADTLPHSEQN